MGLFKRKPSNEDNMPLAPPPPPPPPPAMEVLSTTETRHRKWMGFDADKLAYDVDLKTGLFYAVRFNYMEYGSGQAAQNDIAMTNVPASKEVLALVPEGKRALYIEKFGELPAATEETETQKTLRLIQEQMAELTSHLPPQPVAVESRQQKKPEDGTRLRLGKPV